MKSRLMLLTLGWLGGVLSAGELTSSFSNSYALVIGVNKYPHSKWPRLNYAVNDAQGIAAFLKQQGFEVISLLDTAATRQAIVSAVEDQLAGKLKSNDRVFFFFAGHGQTRPLPGGDRGYLVPYDGTDAYGSLISMDEIRNWSGVMSAAKHQMFVLDACFGGLIATRGSTVDPRTPDYVEAVTKRRSRQILTAGGANQKVADGGPNGHSLFTGQLLKALSDGIGDLNGDGYITFTELAGYIQPAASQYNQTPGSSEFEGHEQGDFIFSNPKRPASQPTAGAATPASGGFRSSVDVYTLLNGGMRSFGQKKYAEALSQLQQAADLGNAEAMAYLGKIYFNGLGVPVNVKRGIEWLEEGAKRGDVLCLKSLVAIYSPLGNGATTATTNSTEEKRWKAALAEAESWKDLNVLVDPSGQVASSKPKIPIADVIAVPQAPSNLRIVP